jgi:hypothetical protein
MCLIGAGRRIFSLVSVHSVPLWFQTSFLKARLSPLLLAPPPARTALRDRMRTTRGHSP